MSAHHGIGLHPYVTPLSFIDSNKFPDVVSSRPTSEESCSPVVDSNGNIYGVEVHDNSLCLMRYKQQDYHENHFVSTPALNYYRAVIQTNALTVDTVVSVDVSTYDIGSTLRVRVINNGTYSLTYNCEGNSGTLLGESEIIFNAITSGTTMTIAIVKLGVTLDCTTIVYAPPVNQEVVINRPYHNYSPASFTHGTGTHTFDIDGERYAAVFPLITPNILSAKFTITCNKAITIAPLNLVNNPSSAISTVQEAVEDGLFETSATTISSGTTAVTYDTSSNVFILVYAYDPASPALTLTISIQIIHYNPFLPILQCVDDVLYLYHHSNTSHVVSYNIESNYGADLVENWSTAFGSQAITGILPSIYNEHANGLMIHGSYVYPYYYLTHSSIARVFRISTTDGTTETHRQYTLPTSTKVAMALSYPGIYVTFQSSALYATYGNISEDDNDNLSTHQMITTNALPPQLIPHEEAVTLFYGLRPNTENIIQFANLFILNDETTDDPLGLGLPVFYNISRSTLYNEPEDDMQLYLHYTYTVNPVNDNYIYLAYITTTDEIRVIKMFRNVLTTPTLFEQYKYMILWSTKVGAFQVFTYAGQGLHIVVDATGMIYVFVRKDDEIYIWKINEFRLNLGHTFDSAITASPNIISDFMNSITTKYDIRTMDPLLIYDLPEIRDVIISSVVDDETPFLKKRITLRYLNYDYFVMNSDARDELIEGFQEAFEQLYAGTEYQVPSAGVVLEGDEEHVILVFSIPAARNNPCVLRGTEIVITDGYGGNSLVPIENITNGSLVINHKGKAIRVKRHTFESLITRDITRPYLIPRHFFGQNRPYKTLAISGDHAILHKGKRLYPKDIIGLKRLDNGLHIEYHHIEMEKPTTNFYLANGLEIESLYFGTRLESSRRKES